MAIHSRAQGIRVHVVRADDKTSFQEHQHEERPDPPGRGQKVATQHIESRDNLYFGISIRYDHEILPDGCGAMREVICLDGKKAVAATWKKPRMAKQRVHYHWQAHGFNVKGKFRFLKLAFDDRDDLDEEQDPFSKLGTIEVKFYRLQDTTPKSKRAKARASQPQTQNAEKVELQQTINEQAYKGKFLSHKIGFINTEESNNAQDRKKENWVEIDDEDHPFVMFTFHYSSWRILTFLGIISIDKEERDRRLRLERQEVKEAAARADAQRREDTAQAFADHLNIEQPGHGGGFRIVGEAITPNNHWTNTPDTPPPSTLSGPSDVISSFESDDSDDSNGSVPCPGGNARKRRRDSNSDNGSDDNNNTIKRRKPNSRAASTPGGRMQPPPVKPRRSFRGLQRPPTASHRSSANPSSMADVQSDSAAIQRSRGLTATDLQALGGVNAGGLDWGSRAGKESWGFINSWRARASGTIEVGESAHGVGRRSSTRRSREGSSKEDAIEVKDEPNERGASVDNPIHVTEDGDGDGPPSDKDMKGEGVNRPDEDGSDSHASSSTSSRSRHPSEESGLSVLTK